jgi:2-methylisocitrate lyase-like PEP mutase family enzyme
MTGISPRFTAEELAAIGIRACILPGAAMRATIMAIHDFATTLKAEGPMAEAAYDARFKQHPMGNLHGFAGFDRIREKEAEFLPAEAAEKYEGGLGYAPKAAE